MLNTSTWAARRGYSKSEQLRIHSEQPHNDKQLQDRLEEQQPMPRSEEVSLAQHGGAEGERQWPVERRTRDGEPESLRRWGRNNSSLMMLPTVKFTVARAEACQTSNAAKTARNAVARLQAPAVLPLAKFKGYTTE
jgi:hypothetical protein